MPLLPECCACTLFRLLLYSLTHLCPPVEFLQGRDGVAEPCLSRRLGRQLGERDQSRRGWGHCPAGAQRARPPCCCELARSSAADTGAAVAALPATRGGAAPRAGRVTRGPGLSSDPFSKCGPFPTLWESFQEDLLLLFFNISFYRTIKKKKKKNGGAERGPFRGGQHFSVLTPTWQPSGFSAAPAPKPSSELGRSAWAAGTFLSSEVCSFLGSLSGECDSAFLLHTFLHGFHHLF